MNGVSSAFDRIAFLDENVSNGVSLGYLVSITTLALAIIFATTTLIPQHIALPLSIGFDLTALGSFIIASIATIRDGVKRKSDAEEEIKNLSGHIDDISFSSQEQTQPSSPDQVIRPLSKSPMKLLVDDVVPGIVEDFTGVVERLIRADSIKAQEDERTRSQKIQKFKEAITAFSNHFKTLAQNPPSRPLPKSSKILRCILAAWNTGQLNQLEKLFDEFQKAEQIAPSKPIETEQELRDVMRRILFLCCYVVEDLSILSTQATADEKLGMEANVSFGMQEAAREMVSAPRQAYEAYEKILKVQAAINKEQVWPSISTFKILNSKCQQYMIIRALPDEADEQTKSLYKKILQCLHQTTNDNDTSDYSHFLPENMKGKFNVIKCSLGAHSTWLTKYIELHNPFLAKTTLPLLKGRISSYVKKNLEDQNLLEKGSTKLDEPIKTFVDGIYDFIVHSTQKKIGMDQVVPPFLNEVRAVFYNMYKRCETENIEELLPEMKRTLQEIGQKFDAQN